MVVVISSFSEARKLRLEETTSCARLVKRETCFTITGGKDQLLVCCVFVQHVWWFGNRRLIVAVSQSTAIVVFTFGVTDDVAVTKRYRSIRVSSPWIIRLGFAF